MRINPIFGTFVHFVPMMTPEIVIRRADTPEGPVHVSEPEINSYFVSTDSAPGPGQAHYTLQDVLQRMLF
jgi:hypothetical protein